MSVEAGLSLYFCISKQNIIMKNTTNENDE